MPYYETVVVVDATSEEGMDEKHLAAIQELISAQKGAVNKVEQWGKRKLAYAIRHKREGIYFLVEFEAPSDAVGKLEQYCRLQESILRYLTISREALSPEGELSPIAKEAAREEPEHVEPSKPAKEKEQAKTPTETPTEIPTDDLLLAKEEPSAESEEKSVETGETETVADETNELLDTEASEPLLSGNSEEPTEEKKETSEDR